MTTVKYPTLSGAPPLVIAHRGASGYLPEHTLQAYRLAIYLGADYIEPDLVATKDGELIVRHDLNLINTTDVRTKPEFVDRYTRKRIDGVEEDGWFADDFTLAEIQTLRAVQPFASRAQAFNGRFHIPTFQRVIDLAKEEGRRLGRTIGIAPETKHPSYHQAAGLGLEPRLVQALAANGLDGREAPVLVQSFEVSNLRALRELTAVKLVQLTGGKRVLPDGTISYDQPYDFTIQGDGRTYADLLQPEGLRTIAKYADALAPWKRSIMSVRSLQATAATAHFSDREAALLPPSDLVQRAHDAGLLVIPYTFRADADYLAADYAGDAAKECAQFFLLGVDALFSDFSDTALAGRARAELCLREGELVAELAR